MYNIEVTREAVCAADDQLNPLVLMVPVDDSERLRGLMARILSRPFLQFSSSHTCITGLACGEPLVRVHADAVSGHRFEFLVAPETTVTACLPDHRLTFTWTLSVTD